MFTEEIKQQIKELLNVLQDEVRITFFTDKKCPSCADGEEFIDTLVTLSDKLKLEKVETSELVPAYEMSSVKYPDASIRFNGIPGGHEINSFLQTIVELSTQASELSQEIIDRIAPTGPYRVVPNGIEAAEWLGPQPAAPEWFTRIPGPRAVYVGTLDNRLDARGLRLLAAARPELQIVLIGPAPDRADVAQVRSLPNVHIRGMVGRREVVAVLRNSELTLLAHRRTTLTEAMSPLKVYEYLGAGRPVLATDLKPVRGLGRRVLLAESVADFADLVDDALELGVQAEHERRAFIEAHAWPHRHAEILSLVKEARR